MSKPLLIYSIAPYYRSCTVWEGSRMTHARMVTNVFTPDKGLAKAERHAAIAAWLFKNFRIPGPCYNSTH